MKRVNNISQDFLLNLNTKENIYLLGRIWADGYLGTGTNTIGLCSKEGDIEFLFSYFESIGLKTIYKRQRYNKDGSFFGKPSFEIKFNSKNIYDFLINNDYHIKSKTSPDKILSKIPDHLKHYWWRGYFDGDGCLYIPQKGASKLNFWSSIDQDWRFLVDLLNFLEINFAVNEYIRRNGKHKSSSVEIGCIKNIQKFGDYIYKNWNLEKIGLNRKYEKYIILKEKISNSKTKKNKYKGIIYNKLTNTWGVFVSYLDNNIRKEKFLGWYKEELIALKIYQDFLKNNSFKEFTRVKKNRCYHAV